MDKVKQIKATLNEALSMCSERSPRWRRVILKLEELQQRIDAIDNPSTPATPELLLTDEEVNQANKQRVAQPDFHSLSPIEQYRAEFRAVNQAQRSYDKQQIEEAN